MSDSEGSNLCPPAIPLLTVGYSIEKLSLSTTDPSGQELSAPLEPIMDSGLDSLVACIVAAYVEKFGVNVSFDMQNAVFQLTGQIDLQCIREDAISTDRVHSSGKLN